MNIVPVTYSESRDAEAGGWPLVPLCPERQILPKMSRSGSGTNRGPIGNNEARATHAWRHHPIPLVFPRPVIHLPQMWRFNVVQVWNRYAPPRHISAFILTRGEGCEHDPGKTPKSKQRRTQPEN
ncbi:hypothetical protein CAOG_009295 [Capsaspora owczarzaki ATCC 30864]|uniref:Uncharacterized protein n=1 Tax=Capsaspora owczarzaki (strain ATCC 30864) TaxID=595528 RepID=A0A0D2VG19_CAPO3|nr:hypothetical protein CAOG_009295 [Capsaspora owczarzaki ATCC 30864]